MEKSHISISRAPLRGSRIVALVVLCSLFAVALVMRLQLNAQVQHPGHGDTAFYFEVAQNLAQRGRLEVDYIWHFLDPPEEITHPAGDYWPVLASVLMAAPMLFGGGLQSALGMSTLFGLMCGALTLALARGLGASRLTSIAACAAVLFHPRLLNYSTSTDAAIYYTAFVTATLVGIVRGARAPNAYRLAALFAALAFCTRQDGMFLLPALALAIVWGPHARQVKRRALLSVAAVYLVAVSPFLANNLFHFGTLLPTGPSRTFFSREYLDIYAYAAPLNWQTYLDWGFDNIWQSKLDVLRSNSVQMRRFLGDGMWLLVGFGLVNTLMHDKRHRSAILAVLFIILTQYLFYSFIGTTVAPKGSYLRSSLSLVPFLLVIGFKALDHCSPKPLVLLLILGLGFPTVRQCQASAQRKVRINNTLGENVGRLGLALERSLSPGDPTPIVMTSAPWEVHFSTGYKTVQMPPKGLQTIREVAKRYGVTHIVIAESDNRLKTLAAGHQLPLVLTARLRKPPARIYKLGFQDD